MEPSELLQPMGKLGGSKLQLGDSEKAFIYVFLLYSLLPGGGNTEPSSSVFPAVWVSAQHTQPLEAN